MSKIVTANTLATGRVVFLATDGRWVEDVTASAIYPDVIGAEAALAEAPRAAIVEAFVTDRNADVEGRPTMTLRDTIRAFGPTIAYRPVGVARG